MSFLDGIDAAIGMANSPRGMGGFICPDCVAGKCGVCQGQAFDEANDLIVDCACTHENGGT